MGPSQILVLRPVSVGLCPPIFWEGHPPSRTYVPGWKAMRLRRACVQNSAFLFAGNGRPGETENGCAGHRHFLCEGSSEGLGSAGGEQQERASDERHSERAGATPRVGRQVLPQTETSRRALFLPAQNTQESRDRADIQCLHDSVQSVTGPGIPESTAQRCLVGAVGF